MVSTFFWSSGKPRIISLGLLGSYLQVLLSPRVREVIVTGQIGRALAELWL